MDGVADLEAGQVDLEELGDGGRLGTHRNLVHDHVQHAAALDARGGRLVLEVHRHLDGDDRVRADAQEVEMQRLVRHRIDLHVARQDIVALAVDVDRQSVIEETLAVHDALDRLGLDRDHHRGLLVAVDHGGNESIATAGTGAPFAGPVPLLRDDLCRLCHFNFS